MSPYNVKKIGLIFPTLNVLNMSEPAHFVDKSEETLRMLPWGTNFQVVQVVYTVLEELLTC